MAFTSNHSDLKHINRLAVINLVKTQPGLSRASIAKQTGLNKSTIGKLVQDLLDEHWLEEENTPTPLDGAGRRPTGLKLKNKVLALIGAEIGVDFLTVLACTITGEILFNRTVPYVHIDTSDTLNQLTSLLDEAWGIMDDTGHHVLGLGVAVPGLVNATDEKIITLPNLNWHDLNLTASIEQHLHDKNRPPIPVSIINDANAAALSEFVFGHSQYRRHALIYFTIGVGFGAGIITDKGLYKGHDGCAGEIGHSTLQPIGGRQCACGQFGCVETLVSQRALSHAATDDNQILSIDNLQQRLAQGDEKVQQGLEQVAFFLGIVMRNIANILNPKTIVIGGPMSQFGNQLIHPAIESLKQHTGRNLGLPNVQLCEFGINAAALGAAAAVLNQLLEPIGTPTHLSHKGLMR
ncbi:ROK family protein [Hydromonas duriensis]|uniref:Putative NBD/HSP70 family sugar kinase n=1 Tax=Hydromonas duriensis TaxID=1527608 RepID=A0A4R6YAX4_9BURK|nr:ROK family protein [Hydromonas duriensis]TDR32742.1 putative NBD/HSP70 family sugar kinase [Hydromonas duriensis]